MMNRLLGAILGLATIFGIRVYNKSAAASEVKTRLASLCESDQKCLASVESHFGACFDDAYQLSSRSQDGQKIARSLVTCLNQKAGEDYFVSSK
ncbi:MAG TPA: hypothetical protein VI589_04355 [Vicinamibacteria bacterium]